MNDGEQRPRLIWLSIVLGLLTLAVYWPVTGHDFISYDDPDYVTENTHVRAGLTWEGFRWAFRSGVGGNWNPVTWLSHMLDCHLYGLNAASHHLTNLVLHIANAILLLWALHLMTRAFWKSAFVAALFALHPLHVESVAWISERKDVLCGLFFTLTLLAYARYAQCTSPQRRGYYALSLAFFTLGLMSKPMLVTVPFLLLLLDYWPLERFRGSSWGRLLSEKVPFFALTIVTSVITFLVQKQAGAMALMDSMPLTGRIANAVVSYGRYLLKTIWPVDLAVFYPFPDAWPATAVIAATTFLVITTVIAILLRTRFPYLAVGWFWFVGMMIPVIGLVQVGLQSMADRYTYLPLTGLFIALCWGMGDLLSRWRHGQAALRIASIAALAGCIIITARQTQYWKNSETLFTHALGVTSNIPVARYALGVIASEAGRYDEAFSHFEEAVRLKPDRADALNNLGLLLVMRGRIDEGIARYRQALEAQSDLPELHFNLASALAMKGEFNEAIAEFRTTLKKKPTFVQAACGLARALIQQGNIAEAKAECSKILEREPNHPEAQLVLGLAFAKEGDFKQAIHHLNEAIRIRPNDPDTHIELGRVLALNGKQDETAGHYRTALNLSPELPLHLRGSAQALAKAGNLAGAIKNLETVVQLTPNDAAARQMLGALHLETGHPDAAITQLAESLRLHPDAAVDRLMAAALVAQGRTEAAILHLRNALREQPEWADALNDLAWILATHPSPEVRDGNEAVKLAESACQLTQHREPQFLGTLAAAYAEAGRFEDAVQTGEKARNLAASMGRHPLAHRNAQLLEKYRSKKAHREEPGSQAK